MILPSKAPPSVQKNNFTQLWQEEYDILFGYASQVPAGGTIVEIGLAQGGTSLLFLEATRGKDVQISSVDIAPTALARQNLENTGIRIIAAPSSEAARQWSEPVDLLFIDGNHLFEFVCNDYNLWLSHVKPGGQIIFHDFDPSRRGGLAHFGVEICCRTIIAKNALSDISHRYKLLRGTVPDEKRALSAEDCFELFRDTGRKIRSVRDRVFGDSYAAGLELLKQGSEEISSVEACYCVDYLLKNNYELLDTQAHSVADFRRWAEALSCLDHGYGHSGFPDSVENISPPASISELSVLVTREQLRISLLSHILQSIVHWKP